MKTVTMDTWVKLDAKTKGEETRQLEELQSEEARREEFRKDHPDLMFNLDDGDNSDSDEGNVLTKLMVFTFNFSTVYSGYSGHVYSGHSDIVATFLVQNPFILLHSGRI